MKNKILLTIGLCFFVIISNAQALTGKQISEHITKLLRINYKPDTTQLAMFCKKSCVFVKFGVNKKGIISNVLFSDNSSQIVIVPLLKAIKKLQYDRPLMYSLSKLNKVVILPFLYDYRAGCRFTSLDSMKFTQIEIKKYGKDLVKSFVDRDNTQEAVLNMISFEKEEYQAIDCILLKPYYDFFMSLPY